MSGKKGIKLRAWGTLRRLASGKWQASYCGPDLARHAAPITCTVRMDAEHWLATTTAIQTARNTPVPAYPHRYPNRGAALPIKRV
jgi:hypothetical protein